ncbi:MAG: hypothetical protein J6A59_09845 [Lachnospiraceae bacterium]|nr:hypothetical protein [Lachnospiraceae bacterium]
MDYVIRNIKNKMNVNEVINWFDYGITIVHAMRISDRGAREEIYVVGARANYGLHLNEFKNYISDTGRGHGGKGKLKVLNLIESDGEMIMSVMNPIKLDENKRMPIWVMV